jgi:hypothetical protein
MRRRLYIILGLLLFIFVGCWFVAHSFVIVRLVAVFGLMLFVAVAIAAFFYAKRVLRRFL